MAYMIGAILSLKDKNFSANIKKSEKGVNKFRTQTKYAGNQVRKFAKTTNSSFKGMAKSALKLTGAYLGIKAVKDFASSSKEAAKAQYEAETKLQAVLKNTPGMAKNAYKHLGKYAEQQQRVGVIGDDIQIAGMQQLATYQLQENTLKTLAPGMNDLLAQMKGLNAVQGDSVNIGNMIGKVMNGQVGALSRAGINFSKAQEKVLKYGTEQEKAAALAKVLQQNVGGVNKALADTDIGSIKQANNLWGDYKENIGKGILKIQGKLAKWFTTKMPQIISFTQRVGTKAKDVFDIIKNYGGTALIYIKDKFIAIKQWGVNTWEKIQQKVKEHQPTIDGVKKILGDIVGVAKNLKDKLIEAFDASKPTIEWLKDEGIPAITDALLSVIESGVGVYNFMKDNWAYIEPIVYGVAGAFAAYKLIMLGVTAVTTAWNIAAGIGTAVTTAFGTAIAVITSPIGIVVAAIGVLIAAGVAIWKNWDVIKEKATEIWSGISEGIGNFIEGIKESFLSVVETAKGVGKGVANFFIRPLNKLIDGINKIQFDTPDWLPFIGGKEFGFNIPKIPEFAMGTQYFSGGLAKTDERGGEIKEYPSGMKIYPHDKSINMAREEGKKEARPIIININCRGVSADEVINEVVPKLKVALANI